MATMERVKAAFRAHVPDLAAPHPYGLEQGAGLHRGGVGR